MSRHLRTCPEREAAIEEANAGPGKVQTLYTIQARDAWSGDYWLYLEMDGTAPLKALDRYLRSIWLECCGHLSSFSEDAWRSPDIPMSRRASQVFQKGVELTHIYDFGTSSHTLVKVVETRRGKPLTEHPLYLMARNNPPAYSCMECDNTASWLCTECMIEHQLSGLLCDEHVEEHPHYDYGEPVAIANSPRVGMCGYCGPAEPPY
jgi:hypothetical protein